MKKLVLLGAVAVLGLSACKKDYTCVYEYDFLGQTQSVSIDCNKCSKSDIEDIEGVSYTGLDGKTYGYECEKK